MLADCVPTYRQAQNYFNLFLKIDDFLAWHLLFCFNDKIRVLIGKFKSRFDTLNIGLLSVKLKMPAVVTLPAYKTRWRAYKRQQTPSYFWTLFMAF